MRTPSTKGAPTTRDIELYDAVGTYLGHYRIRAGQTVQVDLLTNLPHMPAIRIEGRIDDMIEGDSIGFNRDTPLFKNSCFERDWVKWGVALAEWKPGLPSGTFALKPGFANPVFL